MHYLLFSRFERVLAFIAGLADLAIGLAFVFLPELQLPLWPTPISPVLTRFIGAIILGNGAAAFWLSREREWARVRPLAIVAVVYGTIVAVSLLYHLLLLEATSFFWLYFWFDIPFLLVFLALFMYHDIAPRVLRRTNQS